MTILVTGATGFVGLRLCEALCRDGRRVRATLRPRVSHNPKAETLAAMGAETVMLDLTDSADVYRALDGVETVYHLAWQSNRMSQGGLAGGFGGGMANAGAPAETNLTAMETLIGCARSAGVSRFVFTSTVSVYGPTTDWGPLPRRESDARADLDGHRNPYFRSYASAKYRAEQMLAAAFPPPDYVILRPSMVYGPHAQFARQFVEAARGGGGAGETPHPVQWVHVDDVVQALLLAEGSATAVQKVFNIAGATAILNHTVAGEVQRLLSGMPGGAGGLDWAARVPQYDLSAAARDLGYQPRIGWKQGLAEMVQAECDGDLVAQGA